MRVPTDLLACNVAERNESQTSNKMIWIHDVTANQMERADDEKVTF